MTQSTDYGFENENPFGIDERPNKRTGSAAPPRTVIGAGPRSSSDRPADGSVPEPREWHLKVSGDAKTFAFELTEPTGAIASDMRSRVPSGRPTTHDDSIEATVNAELHLGEVLGGELTHVAEEYLARPDGVLWIHADQPAHAAPRWESARIDRNGEPEAVVANGRVIVRTTLPSGPQEDWSLEDLDQILIVDGEAGRRTRVPPVGGVCELETAPVIESLRELAGTGDVVEEFPSRIRRAILVFLGHGIGAPNSNSPNPYVIADRDVTRDEFVAAVNPSGTDIVALGCCSGALGSPTTASIAHELSRAGVKFVIGFDGTTDWTAIPAATAFFLSELKRTGDAAASLRAVNRKLLDLRLGDKIPNVVLYSNVKLRAKDAPKATPPGTVSTTASRLLDLALRPRMFDIVQHAGSGGTIVMEAIGGSIAQIFGEVGKAIATSEGTRVVQSVDHADDVHFRAKKK